MGDENRIPRVRIHEDNFTEEIKNPPYPEEWTDEAKKQPGDYIIEVVNAKEVVIALFYHVWPFNKTDFYNVIDYAKYYDASIIQLFRDTDWIHFTEKNNIIEDNTNKEVANLEHLSWWKDDFHPPYHMGYEIGIISFGRLKYTLGLQEEYQYKYCQIYSWQYDYIYHILDNTEERSSGYYLEFGYPDDPIEYLNFSLKMIRAQVTGKNFNKLITLFLVEYFISAGLQLIKGIADNLFTEDNIQLFIDEAKQWDTEDVLVFLLDYKNMHFPFAEPSPNNKLFGIGRVKLEESDSIRHIPLGKRDFFVDLINPEGNTIALFFIINSDDLLFYEYENWDSIVRNDGWLTPNFDWNDIEYQRWLPETLGEENMQQLLKEVGIKDVTELDFNKIPDGWMDYLHGDMVIGPEESDKPAIFLMAYSRLKYPYKLSKEIHDNCELYIKGFVEKRNLLYELQRISKDPKDIGELFNFCASVFPDKQSFREAHINEFRLKDFVLCDIETFIMIADSILCKENIDRFLDEAHAANKTELKLFLLDYKNKHFPSDRYSLPGLEA